MNHIDNIIKNKIFIENINKINNFEKERIYCRHGDTHLFDVARIAYIKSLEENTGFSKYIIYAAALLHDIGRAEEYEKGTPHEKAGVEIAEKILKQCGFDSSDADLIIKSIIAHRHKSDTDTNYDEKLSRIIRDSDKLSRRCYMCTAQDTCYWTSDKKNMHVKY